MLYRFVRARLNEADAADVVAEVMVVAWRHLDDLPEPPNAYLFGVARKVMANWRRSQTRRDNLVAKLKPTAVPAYPDHAQGVAESELVARAVSRLRPADREVVGLLAAGLSDAATLAGVLGCTENAARVRVHRARTRLAQALAQEDAAVEAPGKPLGEAPGKEPGKAKEARP
jgi:RNA polymerase sigma-70 factor (ECF subfamily)